MVSWLWQRISGLALTILLFLHLWAVRFQPLDFNRLKAQLSSPAYVPFNAFLIAVAASHALNGLWQMGQDHIRQSRTRKIFAFILILVGLGLFSLARAIFI